MQALLNFTTALLRCSLAFFRSRNEQAIVELALRQQLATYAQTRPKRSDNPVGLRISAFEACSAFTRVPACVLARSPKVTLSEGVDRFVTSTTAPAATDWSDQFVGRELQPLRIGALARRTIGRKKPR